MSNFKETSIWKAAFLSAEADEHQSSVNTLVAVFDKARENARTLVSEIAVDLPGYTVHDVEHLDALWEVGSQIVGPDFRLNPIEGFVLGCSFLFHDAAMSMAAYPGGLEQIKASLEWKRIHGRMKASQERCPDDATVIEVFLREQHAIQAEKLPKISWSGDVGSRFLIDDADAREKFGDFIGQVAASHWWDHSNLEKTLHTKTIPAPAPFPSSWSIDLLKLACVLRTADASQIDERRAPSFLRALRRNRLSEYSAQHWTFQNRLTQAQRRNDTLYFAAFRPFTKAEANEWWLLHDTLKMVDGELRKTDDLLARCRGQEARFSARRVANIEAPGNLASCVPTDGWQPIDTAFSISDIPRLVENLGGEQLYGQDSMAAIREVVQNAMDAVRIRRVVDPHAPDPMVEVELKQEDSSAVLLIKDNGVGMSEETIVGKLLSFGTSGWLSDNAIGEYNQAFPAKSSVSGRFGIGFFSVFMLGKTIDIKSRRFDSSPDETAILSFPDGLKSRPLLCGAEYAERMTSGGTEIRICIDPRTSENGVWQPPSRRGSINLSEISFATLAKAISFHFPASDVPICVRADGETFLNDGGSWQEEAASDLLQRIEGDSYLGEDGRLYEQALSLVKEPDGTVVGRATFVPDRLSGRYKLRDKGITGVVAAQGTKLCDGNFRGILLGSPIRAARDAAVLSASPEALIRWASEQSRLLLDQDPDERDQLDIAEQVASLGGDIGELKFCEVGGKLLNRSELRDFLKNRDEIWEAHDAAVSNARPSDPTAQRTATCISVNHGLRPLLPFILKGRNRFPSFAHGIQLQAIVNEIVAEEFGLDSAIIQKMNLIEDGRSAYRAFPVAWVRSDGSSVSVGGKFYKRNMTLGDVDEFFIPEDERE